MSKDAVNTAVDASRTDASQAPADAGDAGYSKDLKSRHVNMIAIGGAIGTGLFLGAGGRLHDAGPALVFAYLVCGIFAYLVVRALGEMVVYRPSSGSFVSYAREFLGEKGAYVAGWMYFLNWSMTGIADITAIALYTQYWSAFTTIPQWVLALIALAVVLSVNLVSVKYFGEMEFWFSIVKVATLVAFLFVGIFLIATQHPVDGQTPGLHMITDNGGWMPSGTMSVILVMQGVVFAYAALELVGVAAGETADPQKVVPRAVNSIMWRVGLFYCGSVLLLALLLPASTYKAGESPFVTLFSKLGVGGIGDIMNLVVLTAAMSSLNSGLYSTGRILRSMAMSGSAPQFTARMNKSQVPYGGILLTAGVGVLGVGLNYLLPADAFEIVIEVSSIGIIGTWVMIMVAHLAFVRKAKQGVVERPSFRLPGSPVTEIVTIVFLLLVLGLMWNDAETGRKTLSLIPVIALLLFVGWFRARKNIARKAAEQLTNASRNE
ncbi:amino acid permease [Streptomyces sp. SID8379]|uniref:amino acid permease n=1 Tax=unclassified Streptomyces TaxID=2593676 RepID=UPI000367ABAB|nr:amino acid permease [Streptomyces sp. HmicA12]MYW62811.1 amino acid permease [Streptomyces sp. SID8379]